MKAVWVLGGNGLLGSAIRRVLSSNKTSLFSPKCCFAWKNSAEITVQLREAVKEFAMLAENAEDWQIYWAAGVGHMGSSEAELMHETQALYLLLGFIGSQKSLIEKPGRIALASSAGAIYAKSSEIIITESTTVTPTTPYAREKLKQESLLADFAKYNQKLAILIVRITTLYGFSGVAQRRQGLLAEIARRILRNQPIQIFVPFDTIRDYISADDAALSIVVAMRLLGKKPGIFIKIIASEQPTTVAEIISIFKRVARRSPRVVIGKCDLSNVYSRRLQFRSTMILSEEQQRKTSLLIGISKLMVAERLTFIQSHPE